MSEAPRAQARTLASRAKVLAAAERLMRADPSSSFSMRELAAEAGVSFATPFNLFGSKAAIARALSVARIEQMTERVRDRPLGGDAIERLLQAVGVAAGLLLEEPVLNRAMMAALGGWTEEPGDVRARSRALWALALGDGDGLDPSLRTSAVERLPDQVALVFRGCLSFWVAGEITDDDLPGEANAAVAMVVAAFAAPDRRATLLAKAR